MAIYLKDATFVDWDTLAFQQAHLRVTEGNPGSLEFLDELPSSSQREPDSRVLDCSGRLVTHSFGNAHHHVYSALARGMPAPPKSPKNFYEILQYIWWRLDKALDLDMIRASALVTALACAKNGVTFVVDHHASPFAIERSLQTIAEAFDQVGVSHLLCYELSDRDGEDVRERGLVETENYLKSGRQGLVGLHASFTVGNDLLERAVALAEKWQTGIHVHVAEDPIDEEWTLREYGKRVLERLQDSGALNFSQTILAHGLHLNNSEREIFQRSRAFLVENVESNWNNNVGVFQAKGLGPRILLGTDGMHSDMLRSAKAAFFASRPEGTAPGEIYNRFRKIHHYVAENSFVGDGANNLVILNYDAPTEITPENFISHFIFGIESRHVESVISSGKLIFHQGQVLTVNEADILTFSREQSLRLWEKLKS